MRRVLVSLLLGHAIASYVAFVPLLVWSQFVATKPLWSSNVGALAAGIFAPLMFPVLMIQSIVRWMNGDSLLAPLFYVSAACYAVVLGAVALWREIGRASGSRSSD